MTTNTFIFLHKSVSIIKAKKIANTSGIIFLYIRLMPEKEDVDVGALEDVEDEEEDVLIGKEVFPRREEGVSTLERFRGITALGVGATLPW